MNKIIQIAVGGENNDKIYALMDDGKLYYQSSMHRNTRNLWYEVDHPEKEVKEN